MNIAYPSAKLTTNLASGKAKRIFPFLLMVCGGQFVAVTQAIPLQKDVASVYCGSIMYFPLVFIYPQLPS